MACAYMDIHRGEYWQLITTKPTCQWAIQLMPPQFIGLPVFDHPAKCRILLLLLLLLLVILVATTAQEPTSNPINNVARRSP